MNNSVLILSLLVIIIGLGYRFHKKRLTNNSFKSDLLNKLCLRSFLLKTKSMGRLGTTEILLIILAIILLFGGKKIPELMKGIGNGIKEFKKASNDNLKEDETENK
jgi:sec-independent protein translocase protein TatA